MDWQSIQPFFHWLSDHSFLAGFFVFLIAFTESLLIVGLIVPGTVLMFGVGTLVGAGALQFWDTIIIAFLGAVAGDAVSFLIGKYYHQQVMQYWPFNKNPDYMTKGEAFFHKHGGKSILFGRFVGPVRPIIPAVAGMMGMSQAYFFFVNIVSAAGWAPFYLIPGIVFGTSLSLAAEVGARLVVILLTMVALILILSWFLKKFYFSMLPWFQKEFISWYENAVVTRRLLEMLFEERMVMQRGAVLLSSATLLSLAFLLAFISNLTIVGLNDIDLIVNRFFSYVQIYPLSVFYDYLLGGFEWVCITFLMLNFLGLSLYFKHHEMMLRFMAAITISCLSLAVIAYLKYLIGTNHLTSIEELFEQFKVVCISTSILFGLKCVDLYLSEMVKLFVVAVTGALSAIIFIGFIYFSHLTVSGLLLAICIAALMSTLMLWGIRGEINLSFAQLFGTTSLVFVLVFSFLSFEDYQFKERFVETKKPLDEQQWLQDDWQGLSQARIGLLGESSELLNIQWRANIEEMRESLLQNDWQEIASIDMKGTLMWLNPEAELENLGHIVYSHNGQREVLTFVKLNEDKSQRLVLRVFSANSLQVGSKPLWLLSLTSGELGAPTYFLADIRYHQNDEMLLQFLNEQKTHWGAEIRTNNNLPYENNNDVLLLYSQ